MSEQIYQPRKTSGQFEGTLCTKCGSATRYVRSKRCVVCNKAYDLQHRSTLEAKERKKQKRQIYPKTYRQAAHIHQKYGITIEDKQHMLLLQKAICAICPNAITMQTACVDHNHKTGKVRGLLCKTCNHAIGLLYDNPITCRNAATYLETSEQQSAPTPL